MPCRTSHDRDIKNIRQKDITELMATEHVVKAHGSLRKSVAQTVAT